MSLLDQFSQLTSNFLGGSNQQASPLLKAVTDMMSQPSGSGSGFTGILQAFQQKGLGGIVASWVGTGENQPISPEQIQQGLGDKTLQQLASKAGTSSQQASMHLAEMLPQLVDKLTPGGQIPENSELDSVLTFLKNKFG